MRVWLLSAILAGIVAWPAHAQDAPKLTAEGYAEILQLYSRVTLNANTVRGLVTAYGLTWQSPSIVLDARMLKLAFRWTSN